MVISRAATKHTTTTTTKKITHVATRVVPQPTAATTSHDSMHARQIHPTCTRFTGDPA